MDCLTCPNCGTDCRDHNMSKDKWDDTLGCGYIVVDFTCPNCGTEFYNVYHFSYQEFKEEE